MAGTAGLEPEERDMASPATTSPDTITTAAGETASVRFLGVTDECDACDRCGRAELKRTVLLGMLDADGNVEAVRYYGTSCAARALGRTGRGAVAGVALEADQAQRRLVEGLRHALDLLAFVGVDPTGRPMFERDGEPLWGPAARRYAMANPVLGGTTATPVERVREAVARHTAVVADARAAGLL